MRSSTKIALTILLICVVGLIFWFNRPSQKSDEQQVQDQLDTIIRGANRNSIGAIMSVVSNDYQDDDNLNAAKLRLVLGHAFRNSPSIDVTSTTTHIVVTGDKASSDGTINIRDINTNSAYYNHAVHLDWQKEKGFKYLIFPTTVWRVIHANYGPLFNDDMGL